MNFIKTQIPDVIIVEPDVFRDERGFFLESYNQQKYQDGGIEAVFVQDNHSRSVKNTLRGLHSQSRRPQAKLVRVLSGAVVDVAVDVRKGSLTFGQWVAVELTEENYRQLFIPRGFLHGFCVLSDHAEFEYKCDDFYDPGYELSVRWDDPDIGIQWPVETPILSQKDTDAPFLSEVRDLLPAYGK